MGVDDAPPDAQAGWKDTDYTPAEEDIVSTDDNNVVSQQGIVIPPPYYPGHEYLIQIAEAEGGVTQIDVLVRFKNDINGQLTKLYIYDFDGAADWEQLDWASPVADTKTTLSGTINANCADYIDTDEIYILICNMAGSDPDNILSVYYAEVQITT